jgi:hypothetical protein
MGGGVQLPEREIPRGRNFISGGARPSMLFIIHALWLQPSGRPERITQNYNFVLLSTAGAGLLI